MPSLSSFEAFTLLSGVEFLVLIISAIDLVISSVYGHALAHAPLEYAAKEDHLTRASTGSVVFYSGTMPLLSILASIIMLFLHLLFEFRILYTLIVAEITMVGWITQVGIWHNCEVSGPTIAESIDSYCPQYPLQGQGAELALGVRGAKTSFGYLVIMAKVLYMALFVYGIIENRREAIRGLPLQMESGSEMELEEDFGRLR